MDKVSTKELIGNIAIDTDLPKSTVKKVIESQVAEILRHTAHGRAVKIHGLGTFTPVDKAERVAHNPRNGNPIHVPAKRVLKFKLQGGVEL